MLFAGHTYASSATYSQVVAFGDSLSDNGNFFALTALPTAPYDMGRLSNGPVWVETLAGNLGITLDARAVAGATTGTVNTNGPYPGMTDQFNTYIAAGPVDPNALYTVWGGANDFLFLGPDDDPAAAIGIAVSNLLAGIGGLMAAGAQHFLVPSLPDLGLTPRALASPDGGFGATQISTIFNTSLSINLGSTFPGADIDFLDTFTILQNLVANPSSLGLTNVTEPCVDAAALPTPALCGNPDEYAFWDDIHPTRVLHNDWAIQARQLVAPVPAAVWPFALDVTNGRALVIDEDLAAVVAVESTSGDRVIVSQ